MCNLLADPLADPCLPACPPPGIATAHVHSLLGARYLPFLGSMVLEQDALEVGGRPCAVPRHPHAHMHADMCVCVQARARVFVCACVHARARSCTQVCVCVCVCAHACACACACVRACVHVLRLTPHLTHYIMSLQVVRLAIEVEPSLLAPAAQMAPGCMHPQVGEARRAAAAGGPHWLPRPQLCGATEPHRAALVAASADRLARQRRQLAAAAETKLACGHTRPGLAWDCRHTSLHHLAPLPTHAHPARPSGSCRARAAGAHWRSCSRCWPSGWRRRRRDSTCGCGASWSRRTGSRSGTSRCGGGALAQIMAFEAQHVLHSRTA